LFGTGPSYAVTLVGVINARTVPDSVTYLFPVSIYNDGDDYYNAEAHLEGSTLAELRQLQKYGVTLHGRESVALAPSCLFKSAGSPRHPLTLNSDSKLNCGSQDGETLLVGKYFSVYPLYVLDGAAYRSLMGHASASSLWAMPGVRCLAPDMWKIFDFYTLDTTVYESWLAEGARKAGSGHAMEGAAVNIDTNRKLARSEAV